MPVSPAKKGFTLIELLIVIIIIGVLAAIAIPRLMSYKERAYYATMNEDIRTFVTAMEMEKDTLAVYPTFGWSSTTGPIELTDSLLILQIPRFSPSVGDTVFVDSISASGYAAHIVSQFLGRGIGRSRCLRYGNPYGGSSVAMGKGISYGCTTNTTDNTVVGSEP